MEVTAQQQERIARAMEDFSVAMDIRSSTSVRVAKRVTAILRIGMVSFGIVALILVLMLYAFTSKMDEMIVALNTMNMQFSSMSADMTRIRATLNGMEQNISHVPAITQATVDIQASVSEMRTEVDGMKGTIADLDHQVYGITNQVDNITGQMRTLDPAVQYISRDVNRLSGPARAFNIFNPFD